MSFIDFIFVLFLVSQDWSVGGYSGARAKSIMNPNISVIIEGIGFYQFEERSLGFLSRNELFFESAVDPFFWGYFSADFDVSQTLQPEVGIDEAYAKTIAVPSFVFTLGKFRSQVSYVNTKHPEFLKFIDYPSAFTSWAEKVYGKGHNHGEEGGNSSGEANGSSGESHTHGVELGHGHASVLYSAFRTEFVPPFPFILFAEVLISDDLKFPVGAKIPFSFGQNEFLLFASTIIPIKNYSPEESSNVGLVYKFFKSYYTKYGLVLEWFVESFYVEIFSLFMRRYETAVRFDFPGEEKVASLSIAFLPSDFSRIRFEFALDLTHKIRGRWIGLQATFSLGPHGAHQF